MVFVAALGLTLLPASPAASGGASLQLDDFPIWTAVYAPGQVVHGSSGVWIKAPKPQGRPEDGPWHAYLVPSGSREGPPLPPDAMRVADVVIEPFGRNDTHTGVRVTFTVPEVEPGKYYIEVCNEPCTAILGDLVGTPVEIARDPMHAVARNEVLMLEQKLERKAYFRERHVKRKFAEFERELTTLKATTDLQLDALREDLRKERARRTAESSSFTPATSSTVGALFVLLLIAAWRHRPRTEES